MEKTILKTYRFDRVLSVIYLIAICYILGVLIFFDTSLISLMIKNSEIPFSPFMLIGLIQLFFLVYTLSLIIKSKKISIRKYKKLITLGSFFCFFAFIFMIFAIAMPNLSFNGIPYEISSKINELYKSKILLFAEFSLFFGMPLFLIILPILCAVKHRNYKKVGYEASQKILANHFAAIASLKQKAQLTKAENSKIKQMEKAQIIKQKQQEQENNRKQKEEQMVAIRKQKEEKQAVLSAKKEQERKLHKEEVVKKNQIKQAALSNKLTSFHLIIWIVQFLMAIFYTMLLYARVSNHIFYTFSYRFPILIRNLTLQLWISIIFITFIWIVLLIILFVNYLLKDPIKKMLAFVILNVIYVLSLLISLYFIISFVDMLFARSVSFGNMGDIISLIILSILFIVQMIIAIIHLVKSIKDYVVKKNNELFIQQALMYKEERAKAKEMAKQNAILMKEQKIKIEKLIAMYKAKDKASKVGNYDEVQKIATEIVLYQQQNGLDKASYFDGTLLQLIGYRILSNIIIMFSLGIAYPWALCMMKKWEIVHTVVDGKRLSFDGTGGELFGKYIIWLLLSFITLGIYGLWLGINVKKWIVSHTYDCSEEERKAYLELTSQLENAIRSNEIEKIQLYRTKVEDYQNTHQIKGLSKFDAGLLKLIGTNLLNMLILLCTLGIMLPWAICMKQEFFVKHTIILGKRQNFDGKGIQFFGLWIKYVLLIIVTLGIYSFWIPISLKRWIVSHIHYVEE